MGIHTNILSALNTRLKELVSPDDVDWENTKYNSTINTPYYRPTLLPAASSLNTLNKAQRYSGIYQIDIYVPLNKGTYTLTTLMDDIEEHFKSNLNLVANSTTVFIQAISRGLAQRQDAWYAGNIDINYICYS